MKEIGIIGFGRFRELTANHSKKEFRVFAFEDMHLFNKFARPSRENLIKKLTKINGELNEKK